MLVSVQVGNDVWKLCGKIVPPVHPKLWERENIINYPSDQVDIWHFACCTESHLRILINFRVSIILRCSHFYPISCISSPFSLAFLLNHFPLPFNLFQLNLPRRDLDQEIWYIWISISYKIYCKDIYTWGLTEPFIGIIYLKVIVIRIDQDMCVNKNGPVHFIGYCISIIVCNQAHHWHKCLEPRIQSRILWMKSGPNKGSLSLI